MTIVPNKTVAGRDEIQSRAPKLPNVLRQVLLMVDGQRSVGQLRGVVAGLQGRPTTRWTSSKPLGLIGAPRSLAAAAAATHPGSRPCRGRASRGRQRRQCYAAYAALYTLMSETVRDHLGLRGYFLQLKVERCTDVAELMTLLPDFSNALGKAKDVGFATEMERRFRALAQA